MGEFVLDLEEVVSVCILNWFAVREPMVDVLTIRSGMRESLQTFRALERLLTRVQSLVLSQVVLVLESLVAIHTFVGALVGMLIFVPSDRTLLGECLVALVTRVDPIDGD